MPPQSRNTKEFKALQAKWYKKLKSTGFQDVEQSEDSLKEWHSFSFPLTYNATVVEGKQEYYRLAGQFVHDNDFRTELERLIWTYHSEGFSIRKIAHIINGLGHKTTRDIVYPRLKKLIKEMFAYYRSDEMSINND